MMRVADGRLKVLFRYEPETGALWRLLPSKPRHKVGSRAGFVRRNGYRYVGIDGVEYLAHRLVWLYMTGDWPRFEIDHINHSRDDNRWENLRDVRRSRNQLNRAGAQCNSATGVLGVSPYRGKYRAQLGTIQLHGLFLTIDGARAAYLAAKEGMLSMMGESN